MQRVKKQRRRAWKLGIEAKANNLALRLKATKALPPAASNLFQFSLRLKLASVIIHVTSKYKPSAIWPTPLHYFLSKFVAKVTHKFRRRTTPAAAGPRTTLHITPPPTWKAMTIVKGWDYCGGSSSALLRNLYLLRRWISQIDQIGIILAVRVSGWTGPIRYYHASSGFKNKEGFGRKLSILLVWLLLLMLLIAVFSPSVVHYLLLHVRDHSSLGPAAAASSRSTYY